MNPQSQLEIDSALQLKIVEAALELNKLFLQAAALGLGVHLNEKREMTGAGVEVVQVFPQVYRYVEKRVTEPID